MIMPVFVMLLVWPFSLLNMTHVLNRIDPVDSLLLAIGATIFSVRYYIRHINNGTNNGTKKKALSF